LNDEEFVALTERYAKLMASAIRRVCGYRHQDLIPDVEQEVRVALWKRLRGGKEIEHPRSYLYKVALTTALEVVQRQAGQRLAFEDEVADMAENPGTLFGTLLPPERAYLLEQVLQRLPLEESRAVRAHLAGFSHVEIAGLYGWTESVARHRVYRSIERLRRALQARGVGDEGDELRKF
jgi:RNA polymerase sigma-70 factor (ECF subfamily)